MTARENILRDIRRNLDRTASLNPPVPAARIRISQVSLESKIESVMHRVAELAGKPFHARSSREAAEYVNGIVAGRSAVASNAPFLRQAGITSLPGVVTGFTEEAPLRALCATAEFGITSADYMLADTGSLVMIASPDEARLISLLPPTHIAVVPAERILSGLDELYTLVPKPSDRTSSMVFITGPSRTADIEQILVRGVHGPGEIHVVIVE